MSENGSTFDDLLLDGTVNFGGYTARKARNNYNESRRSDSGARLAASIIAKVYQDKFGRAGYLSRIRFFFNNAGYAAKHRAAIDNLGVTRYTWLSCAVG